MAFRIRFSPFVIQFLYGSGIGFHDTQYAFAILLGIRKRSFVISLQDSQLSVAVGFLPVGCRHAGIFECL